MLVAVSEKCHRPVAEFQLAVGSKNRNLRPERFGLGLPQTSSGKAGNQYCCKAAPETATTQRI